MMAEKPRDIRTGDTITIEVEVVDTWEMTISPLDESVVRGAKVPLPVKPYQALILRRVH